MSSIYLGRSSGSVTFMSDHVIKNGPSYEPKMMMEHPEVFVPVLSVKKILWGMCEYTMPLWLQPTLSDQLSAFLEGPLLLKTHLWSKPAMPPPSSWRENLFIHLDSQCTLHNISIDRERIKKLVGQLPVVAKPCKIHGDPTLANMVCDPKTWKWRYIDPLQRSYIPNDPHVDLGKIYQSLAGYEAILTGYMYDPNGITQARELADMMGLEEHYGRLWHLVHCIRLIPYQTERVRHIYERYLNVELDHI